MGSTSKSRSSILPEPLERRRLLSSAVWDIHGDFRTKKADTITVDLDPADLTHARATVNGTVVGTRALSSLSQIRVFSGKGHDKVEVNLANGPKLSRVIVAIFGGAGNDTLSVFGARAKIFGGAGNDAISGWTGRDVLDGGAGDDWISGYGGNDTVRSGAGADTVNGEPELDSVAISRLPPSMLGHVTIDHERLAVAPSTGEGGVRLISPPNPDIGVIGVGGGVLICYPPIYNYPDEPVRHFDTDADVYRMLIDAAVERSGGVLGQPVAGGTYWYDVGERVRFLNSVAVDSASVGSLAVASSWVTGSVSGTNTQVADVDEADLIETDGQYLYTAVGNELVIVSADPSGQMEVVSRTTVDGQITGLYLTEDGTVTVVAGLAGYGYTLLGWRGASAVRTTVTTFDVTDPGAPELVEKTEIRGRLAGTRVVDGRVYGVVDSSLWLPPPVQSQSDLAVYESEAEYRERLEGLLEEAQLPYFSTTTGDGATREGSLVTAESVHLIDRQETSSWITSVILIDPAAGEPGVDESSTAVGTSAGTVYATAESLYVVGTPGTRVSKFDLTPDSVSYAATGAVSGSILNQFALGENRHGDLNIATTQGSGASVYTLRQNGDELEMIGSVTGIAPGEQIRSVRFVGDRGYLVTFRQVDPFFTLDLSKPSEPQVVGELKIPGFSSYLHPLDDRYVLGVGRRGDDGGAIFGLQLSLFDVIDPANPVRLFTYSFDDELSFSGSQAESDHHAFQYFPEHKTLAFATTGVNTATGQSVNGTTVIKIDPASGFEKLGFIDQAGATRSVRIGSTLYTLGGGSIKASDIGQPSTLFGTVEIGEANPVFWPGSILVGRPVLAVTQLFLSNAME